MISADKSKRQPTPLLQVNSTTRQLQDVLGLHFAKTSDVTPYLDYIESSWTGRGDKDGFLRFFIDTVSHFGKSSESHGTGPRQGGDRSIQNYIDQLHHQSDHYFFNDTLAGSPPRLTGVKETVLLIIGTWLLSQSYYIPGRQDQRRIVYAYCISTGQGYSEETALSQSISNLITSSGLLPSAKENATTENESSLNDVSSYTESTTPFALHSSVGLLESLSVESVRLNAFKLSTFGRVKILWTTNILRHMLLTKHSGFYYLELFSLPCALQGGAEDSLPSMGISSDLIDEIEASYSTLFNPKETSTLHKLLDRILGFRYWCWCLSCASFRLRRQMLAALKKRRSKRDFRQLSTSYQVTYDDQLRLLMERDSSHWDQTDFKNLWPRILALDSHLQQARPWNIWILFRDRRDTVQYWTFLFGTVILFLTVVQVILGVAQVVGSFQ